MRAELVPTKQTPIVVKTSVPSPWSSIAEDSADHYTNEYRFRRIRMIFKLTFKLFSDP